MASEIFSEFLSLPRFPDGRIDYTTSKRAPIVLCFVWYDMKLLILKRSNEVGLFKGRWDVVAGYVDNPSKSVEEHALIELDEEVGIREGEIEKMTVRQRYEHTDAGIKTWVVYPVLVEPGAMPTIQLNTHENTEYEWVTLEELKGYDTVPGFDSSLRIALGEQFRQTA